MPKLILSLLAGAFLLASTRAEAQSVLGAEILANAGTHEVGWDGKSELGMPVAVERTESLSLENHEMRIRSIVEANP